jgi:hypothetical protein
MSGVCAGFAGIKHDEPMAARIGDILDEAVLVRRVIREGRTEPAAVVVVAEKQVELERRAGEQALELPVGCRLPVMRQVAGHDDGIGVGEMLFHMRQAALEAADRIGALDRFALDVDVGQMDEFHERGTEFGRLEGEGRGWLF